MPTAVTIEALPLEARPDEPAAVNIICQSAGPLQVNVLDRTGAILTRLQLEVAEDRVLLRLWPEGVDWSRDELAGIQTIAHLFPF